MKKFVIASLLWFAAASVPIFGQTIGSKVWDFYAGGEIRSSPAIDSSGTIYFGTTVTPNGIGSIKRFFAVRPDGTMKWSFETPLWPYGFTSSPVVGRDGMIYVGNESEGFYCFFPDGTEFWNIPLNITSTPAMGADGTLYLGEGYLYAISDLGYEKWHFGDGWSFSSTPVVGPNGTIYAISNSGNSGRLYAVSPSGSQVWADSLASNFRESTLSVGPGGIIYVAAENNYLYALNPNGTMKWKYYVGAAVEGAPAIAPDGTVMFGVSTFFSPRFVALRPDGTLRWKISTPGPVVGSPAIASDGTIYFVSSYTFFALNPNGTVKWKYNKGGSRGFWESSPVIANNGMVYVGSIDNYLYAFKGSAPLAKGGWPMIQGNSHHSGFSLDSLVTKVIGISDVDGYGQPDIIREYPDRRLGVTYMYNTSVGGGDMIQNGQPPSAGWRAMGVNDFSGGGNPDLLLFNTVDRRLAVWSMNGTQATGTNILRNGQAVPLGWRVAGTGDIDGDGKADILLQYSDGRIAAWLMNQLTFVKSIILANGRSPGLAWKASATGDFDHDGATDILFQNSTTGSMTVWLMKGTNFLKSVPLRGGISPGLSWRAAAIGDMDGDTYEDVLLQNKTTGALSAWMMTGTNYSSTVSIKE